MSDLQTIRRAYEAPVETALATLVPPIPVYTDNRFYDADDAKSEFCLCRLSFGLMSENTIGVCGDVEFIRGSLVIEVFTPKGAGPGRGQEIAQALWQAFVPLNRVLGGTSGVCGPHWVAGGACVHAAARQAPFHDPPQHADSRPLDGWGTAATHPVWAGHG